MSYSDLVHQAFIAPIRSVLIVDDEYPTWDSVLSGGWVEKLNDDKAASETWQNNQKRVSDAVSTFRTNSPSMIVDIDDGKSLNPQKSEDIAEHLHQSDLLILDYQLDGREGNGEKSICLANKILENDHFNLVVVHTTEDRVNEAFENLVVSLISTIKDTPEKLVVDGQNVLQELARKEVDDNDDNDELADKVNSIVEELSANFLTTREYIYCYSQSSNSETLSCAPLRDKKGPLGPYIAHAERELNLNAIDTLKLGAFILHGVGKELSKKFSKTVHGSLKWSDRRDGNDVSWIRSSKGFIAYANKSDATSLLEVLQKALEHWGPTPSRLLSARMRSEIEKQGVIAEDEIFADSLVFRKFYEGLSSSEPKNTDAIKRAALESQIKRQMESLGDQSIEAIVSFGKQILECDTNSEEKPQGFIDDYGVASEQQLARAGLHYNSYICTKTPSGLHISTGHIFSVADTNQQHSNYWICLSPVCDMVPGQRLIGVENIDSNTKPFLAVKLQNITDGEKLGAKEINSNEYVFLNIDNKIVVKSIYANSSKNGGKDPHWRMFFAKKSGWFDGCENSPISSRKLDVQWLVSNNSALDFCSTKVEIQWQLRYEYALNLNQKLGSNLTRVGLDFMG